MHDLALPTGRAAIPFPSAHLLKEEIVLGFDFGTRRLGVAVGNAITLQARPLALIADVGDVRWRRISELIGSWQPARLVVGIPRHPDGTAHELTAGCERFARQLEGRYRLPVARVDERYSSAVVEDGRDDEAAAVILQQWFDEMHSPLSPGPSPAGGEGKRTAASPGDAGDEHD
jgi:putative Holliday junction resolvase